MERKIDLPWVREAQQPRSRKTMTRILDAAEALLLERGSENVSMAEIAAEARSSVGAIYARFQDKNGLMQVLHQRFSEEAIATTDAHLAPERWEDASASEILNTLIHFMVRSHKERAGLFRAFYQHGHGDPDMLERNRRVTRNFVARLQALLRTRHGEIGHPDPVLGIAFGLALVLGMLKNTFILNEGLHNPGAFSLEVLEAELVRAYHCYLHLQSPLERACGPPGLGQKPG